MIERPLMRVIISLPAVAMAVTVVITGNHYVVDIVAGVVVSLTAYWVIVLSERVTAPLTVEPVDEGELTT